MLPPVYTSFIISLTTALGLLWFLLPYLVRRLHVRKLERLCRQHRLVVLSFDDGPSESLTPKVADLLRHLGIKASFFFIGGRALQHPEIVRQISTAGHDVGSHTSRHLNAWKSMPAAHCHDVLEGHRQIASVIGETSLFRPPYGKMSLASLVLARMARLSVAWWTVDARDSLAQPRSHEDVLARIKMARGGIVLLHDYDSFPDPSHGEYVLGLIRKIAVLACDEGFRFATFSDLSDLASSGGVGKSNHASVQACAADRGPGEPRMRDNPEGAIRVLAVASSGGHWVQLMRLRPAWQGCSVAYLTTDDSYAGQVRHDAEIQGWPPPRFYVSVSANRWQKLRLVRQLLTISWIVVKERPHTVISTGASPGYFAIRVGQIFGAQTIWVDSIANGSEMSLAGLKAGKATDLWLTQWESISQGAAIGGRRPEYWGAVV